MYCQPFYVGRNNPHFKGISADGYLPALEDYSQPEEPPAPFQPEPEWTVRQWDMVNQIRAEVIHWRKQHAETLLEVDGLRSLLAKKGAVKYE